MATDAPSGFAAPALIARLRPRRETVVLALPVLAGSGSGVAAAVTAGSHDLSTLVFLVTVALLFWPPFGAGE